MGGHQQFGQPSLASHYWMIKRLQSREERMCNAFGGGSVSLLSEQLSLTHTTTPKKTTKSIPGLSRLG